jgi:hypothetical protein
MANYKKLRIPGKDARFKSEEEWAALVKGNEGELWGSLEL